MSNVLKAVVVLMSVTVATTACSKKKSSGPSARNKPSAANRPMANPPPVESDEFERRPRVRMNEEEVERREEFREEVREEREFREVRPAPAPAPAPRASERRDYRRLPEPPEAVETREPRRDDFSSRPGVADVGRVDTSEPGGVARNTQCGTAFRRNSEAWAPGLPNAPAENRICTGAAVTKVDPRKPFQCNDRGAIVYTDARQDGLMALIVDRVNRLPRAMDLGSRELAKRIRDVKVRADFSRSSAVDMQIALMVGPGRYEKIELRGNMAAARGRSNGDVQLRAVSAPGNLKFSAVLTCADMDMGCQNALIRLQQHYRSGKIGRVAYLVYRRGDAHVTISEQDRMAYRQIPNQAHARFAEYLSNTSYNSCVAILRDAFSGVRQLPSCAFQRLKDQCGRRAQFKQPAAKAFEFRSWAVAYGRSGFEFEMSDSGATRFSIKGPLVASYQLPVWPPVNSDMSQVRGLTVAGALARSIERVALVANDGGGNLNLQIVFKGEEKSQTRVSVTTLMEDTRFNAEHLVQRGRQMPELAPNDLADERDHEEMRAQPRRAPAPPGRAAPPATQPRPPARATPPAAAPAKAAPAKAAPATAKPAPATAKAKPTTPPPAAPTAAPAPRQEAPPATPPPAAGGVPAREQEDNLTVQPSEDREEEADDEGDDSAGSPE